MREDRAYRRSVSFEQDMIEIIQNRARWNKRSFQGELTYLLELALSVEDAEIVRIATTVKAEMRKDV